jgi:hypothetical protein
LEGPRVEEGPNAEELALAAPSVYYAFSCAEIEIHQILQARNLLFNIL